MRKCIASGAAVMLGAVALTACSETPESSFPRHIDVDGVREQIAAVEVPPGRAGSRRVDASVAVSAPARVLVALQVRCPGASPAPSWRSPYTTGNTIGDRPSTNLALSWITPKADDPQTCGLYLHSDSMPQVRGRTVTVERVRMDHATQKSGAQAGVPTQRLASKTGASVASDQVTIPTGARSLTVRSQLQVSTVSDGQSATTGETIVRVRGTPADCLDERHTSQHTVTAAQHHRKWTTTTEVALNPEPRCLRSVRVSVGLRNLGPGGLLLEDERYSSLLVTTD